MKDLPTLRDILPLFTDHYNFFVYYNEYNEDFTYSIAASGTLDQIRNSDTLDEEVAQIQFDARTNSVIIFII